MEKRTLTPQCQRLLLLLPLEDLETCWCIHQITVTWVSCLTSILGVHRRSSHHLPTECSCSPSPGVLHRLSIQLSVLIYYCSSLSCATHQNGEKLLSQLCSGTKKPILGRLSPSITPAIQQLAWGLSGLADTYSFFVLLKVISKLIFSSYCLMIPNSLTFSRCACFIIDKFHLYSFLSQQNFSESNNIHRVSLFP